jgi:hypothetical protein
MPKTQDFGIASQISSDEKINIPIYVGQLIS